MRTWTRRRWSAAVIASLGAGLALGLPTDLVPNPIFGRQIEAPLWAYPAWVVTSLLAGLLIATYVCDHAPVRVPAGGVDGPSRDSDAAGGVERLGSDEKRFAAGGLLSVFAIGCPTCNALVVMALGTSGALAFFEPVQPALALGGIGFLGWALRRRLTSERSCDVPRD